jgi:hypothetical protein
VNVRPLHYLGPLPMSFVQLQGGALSTSLASTIPVTRGSTTSRNSPASTFGNAHCGKYQSGWLSVLAAVFNFRGPPTDIGPLIFSFHNCTRWFWWWWVCVQTPTRAPGSRMCQGCDLYSCAFAPCSQFSPIQNRPPLPTTIESNKMMVSGLMLQWTIHGPRTFVCK